jgi:hypothetical protein
VRLQKEDAHPEHRAACRFGEKSSQLYEIAAISGLEMMPGERWSATSSAQKHQTRASHMSNPSTRPSRFRRWPLFLVLGLVVALAVAWTGFWFYAAAQAKTEIASWRERERQAGRRQDCASLSVGGYPFRIEVRCADGNFELQGTPTLRLDLPSVLAVVQVYDPRLLISEFKGPLNVSQQSGRNEFILDWDVGRASARGRLPSQVERVSLALDALSIRDSGAGNADPTFKAQHFELHGRQAPGSRAADPAIEAVLQVKHATAEKVHPIAATPINADVTSVIHGLDDFSAMPWPQRLKEWQAHNGEIEIIKSRIEQGTIIAEGAGTLRLTREGRLNGNLQVTVIGIEDVLRLFNLERLASQGQVGAALNALDRLLPGLGGIARQSAAPGIAAALGQRAELDGKPATGLPIRFVDGTVFLGPFQVGVVPPLF